MRCAYGNCNSDSRYKHKEHMKGVSFIPFPKPKSNLQRCKAWIACCGRKEVELNISNITKNSYVCSKHFRVSIGPTAQFPDPIPFSQENAKNVTEWKGSLKKELTQDTEFAHSPPDFEKSSASVENNCFETTGTSLPLSVDNNTYVVFEDSDKPKLAYSHNVIEVSDEDDNGYSPKSENVVNATENEIIQNPDVTVWAEEDTESQLDSREEYYNDYTQSDSNDVPLNNFNNRQDPLAEQQNSKIKYKTSEQSSNNSANTIRTFSDMQNICQTRGFHKIRYCLGADRICEDGTRVPRLVYKCEFCGQTYEAKGDNNSSSF